MDYEFIFDLTEDGVKHRSGHYDPFYFVETNNNYAWSDPMETKYRVVDSEGNVIAGPCGIREIADEFERNTETDPMYLRAWADNVIDRLESVGML